MMAGGGGARVALSGVNGPAGARLVSFLKTQGADLLLVGDPRSLRAEFPDTPAAAFSEAATMAKGFKVFVNLEGIANHPGPVGTGLQRCTDLVEGACKFSETAGIGRTVCFIPAAAAQLSDEIVATLPSGSSGPKVQIVFVPAFASGASVGTAAVIRAALNPTVSAETLGRFILEDDTMGRTASAPIVLSDRQMGETLYGALMRTFDLAVSAAFVLCFFWLFVMLALIVRLDSRGPAIYRQRRVGQDGRVFTCFKFRTMFVSTQEAATHEVPKSAVTRVGAVLRLTKLDELPQLFNVLFNHMSLVGPRPCLPSQTELVAERKARGVLAIKPGITGLAQVNSVDMNDPSRLARWDRHYLDLRSVTFDMKILIETVLGRGGGDNVQM